MRLVIQLVPNLDEFFYRGRQKLFAVFVAFFAPIREVLTTSSESPKVGQTHSRLPTRLKTGRKENFVILNLHIRQPSRSEKNYKPCR